MVRIVLSGKMTLMRFATMVMVMDKDVHTIYTIRVYVNALTASCHNSEKHQETSAEGVGSLSEARQVCWIGMQAGAGDRSLDNRWKVRHAIEAAVQVEVEETSGRGCGAPRIRCPKCGWSPQAHDRWLCNCGQIWNTFDTGGICPGCLYQWAETVCLLCHRASPHSDWYEE